MWNELPYCFSLLDPPQAEEARWTAIFKLRTLMCLRKM
jgi:hypothetical protein